MTRARMASALYLARELSLPSNSRIWQCLRVLDIWHAARMGAAPLVPAAGEGDTETQSLSRVLTGENCSIGALSDEDTSPYFNNLVRLSLIVALLLERIYGPSGLRFTSNGAMLEVRNKLDAWRDGLPSELVANDRWATREAGESVLPRLPNVTDSR